MNFFSYFRRKKRKHAEKNNPGRTSASVAKAVLAFLALGLTDGIESITKSYKTTKVDEFVTVSKAILNSLKQGYENKFSSDFVVMSMKVNDQQKQIELTQLGRNVMLSLDTTTDIITSITLTEIYANLRNDIIKHPEIYGKELHLVANSFPDPNKLV
jgi:hypothetical protein